MRRDRAGIIGIALLLAALVGTGTAAAEEVGGNNLSFPVVWSGGTLPLPGAPGVVTNGGAFTELEGETWYHQQDPLNSWQAGSVTAAATFGVDAINWGDNLESKSWPYGSVVRVENVLFENLGVTFPVMDGYTMHWISGSGIDEMWGSNLVTYAAPQATVYASGVVITIQRVADLKAALPNLVYDGSVWTVDGVAPPTPVQEVMSAEINVSGKVVYGYNWATRDMGLSAGIYRITFAMPDGFAEFDEATALTPFGEVAVAAAAGGGGKPATPGKPAKGGGIPGFDADLDITWIDVTLTVARGGGRN